MFNNRLSAGRSSLDVEKKWDSAEIFEEIFRLLALAPSDVFFNYFAQLISENLQVEFVSICFVDKQVKKLHPLTIWSEGLQVEDTFSSEKVKDKMKLINDAYSILQLDEKIFELTPDILNTNLKSFLQYPLCIGDETIGMIEIFSERKLEEGDSLVKLIKIFYPRICGELLRTKGYEEMKNQYKKYKDIFDQCPIGIMLEDDEEQIDFNPGLANMFGFDYSNESVRPADIFMDFEEERSRQANKLIANEKEKYNNEISLTRKNGKPVFIKLTMVNIFDNNTQAFQCLSVIEDITRAKVFQKALDEQNELFRKLYENCPVGIVISKQGKMIKVNPRFCEMLKYTEREILQFSVRDITSAEDNFLLGNKYDDYFNDNANVNGNVSLEKRYVNKYGEMIWAKVVLSVVRDQKGEVLFTIAMIEDITEQQKNKFRLKEKLQELDEKNTQLKRYIDSNLQLENFAYVASHDLKEPLRTIGNFTQLLERQLKDKLNPNELEYLSFVINGVQDMNQLIDDLLTFSLVNKQDHEYDAIKLPALLFAVTKSLEKSIQDKNVKINFHNIPEVIVGNRTKIKQVFQNLITNAIKFSKVDDPAPQILISCVELSKHWRFEVRDHGIGIKPEYFDKIFRLFQKLHAKHEYEGTGIGLAICKRIVEQHDGAIWLESEPDKGTSFFFTIIKNPEDGENYMLT